MGQSYQEWQQEVQRHAYGPETDDHDLWAAEGGQVGGWTGAHEWGRQRAEVGGRQHAR